MGPRSDERGNGAVLGYAVRGSIRLQWGRAQMSAEMLWARMKSSGSDGLQWGRAQMSAEISLLPQKHK